MGIVARSSALRPSVARSMRRPLALAIAAVLAACSPAPSATSGNAPASPSGSQIAATSPICHSVDLHAEVPATPAESWADRVFYEVFVRSFADSDGDGVGDLGGLATRLDYLNDGNPVTTDDLGVTGIWLMPVAEAASYHGYDVTDYAAVEPDYGNRASLRAFIEAAHERGILVIVDFVINHTSRDHPWFKDALAGGEHRDWYVWSDTNPGWPPVAGPSPWHETASGDFYYGAFWEGMPDLNLRNPEVTAELERIANVWLDDDGVDGFRIDAAKHLIEVDGQHQANTQETLDWLAGFSDAVHASHPDAVIVDEVFDIATQAGRYVPDSADLTFDFGLAAAFRSALQNGRTAPIKTALGETLTAWPPNRQAPFLTNHDQDRVMSQLNADGASAKLAALLLMTAPGVPFVYYGEEIGMQGRKPDERIRAPMQWTADAPAAGFSTAAPWEPLADDWATVNVASQTGDPASLLSTYRDAIAFRAEHPALAQGRTWVVDGGAESVIGWLRATADEALLTVVNVGASAVTDYGLSFDDGPLCGANEAGLRLSVGDPEPPPDLFIPEVTRSGGLDGYRPLAPLAPRSGYVIELRRQQ